MDGKYIKSAFKIFLILVVVALVAQLISFGIYWYNVRNFANKDFNKSEKARCERVLNREEGDVLDYSYCKQFIDWLDANSNIDK
jgi:hypothetical protein